MPCYYSSLGSRIRSWLRDYDRIQDLAVVLIYIQVSGSLPKSLGFLHCIIFLLSLLINSISVYGMMLDFELSFVRLQRFPFWFDFNWIHFIFCCLELQIFHHNWWCHFHLCIVLSLFQLWCSSMRLFDLFDEFLSRLAVLWLDLSAPCSMVCCWSILWWPSLRSSQSRAAARALDGPMRCFSSVQLYSMSLGSYYSHDQYGTPFSSLLAKHDWYGALLWIAVSYQ